MNSSPVEAVGLPPRNGSKIRTHLMKMQHFGSGWLSAVAPLTGTSRHMAPTASPASRPIAKVARRWFGSRKRLDPRQVKEIVESLGLDPAELPGEESRV
jgi:hypothetical protein